VVFGFTLCWVRFSDPAAIRKMLLFEDGYLWLVFVAAVVLTIAAVRLVRRFARRSLWTHEPIAWQAIRPARSHVLGSVIFGAGWAITASCPGPVATQLGQGIGWGAFVMGGIVIGMRLHGRRQAVGGAEPARAPSAAATAQTSGA
jgi:uncharacterized membrane protein YedE/YeeE